MRNKPVKYPVATVTPYGPDDKTVTKLAVGFGYRFWLPEQHS